MCATLSRRCQHALVATAVIAPETQVEHITGFASSSGHHVTAAANVQRALVIHPSEGFEAVRLPTCVPYHLEATVRVLQRRPTNLVDLWKDDRYLRVIATADGLVLIEVANRGKIDEPDVQFSLRWGNLSITTVQQVGQRIRTMLGLDVDPRPLQRLAEAEYKLRPTALALRGMRPPRFAELFETFANVMPFQQLSLDAGAAIVARLVERFGEHLEHGGLRFHAFPTASAIAEARLDALRKCGLSFRKAESLRYIAKAIASGELTEKKISGLSTNDALKTLAELPNIGPWSASLVLLRGFGRLDVFPPGDVGAVRGLRALMRLGPRASLERIVERFGERRGYLYFCALGGSLLAKRLIHAASPVPPLS
ncbi:MAG: AlkA N-terminal domain-containing protein [Betaproteobacteria bacterium]